MLWNHGGGARNTGADSPELETAAASRLICEDDNTGDASESDYLFTDELQQALAAAADDADFPVRVDLIGVITSYSIHYTKLYEFCLMLFYCLPVRL